MTLGYGITGLLLLAVAAAFAARFFLLRGSLRRAGAQLERINADPTTNERLFLSAPDKELAALLSGMNRRLAESQAMRIEFENREKEFRRQIANISHDLRTPLTAVLGYLELLGAAETDSAAPGGGGAAVLTADERREYLGIVTRKAKALQALISEFYDLSRLESGEYPLTPAPVDLHRLLGEALAAFYRELSEGAFRTEVSMEEGLPPVRADYGAVQRIFFNFLHNIRSHGCGRVWISQAAVDGAVVTRFSNEAPGVEAADMERVFERFYTADEMRTGENTGLGMTIAKRLLEQMGHQVTAYLEPCPAEEDCAGGRTAKDGPGLSVAADDPAAAVLGPAAPAVSGGPAASQNKRFVVEIRWQGLDGTAF